MKVKQALLTSDQLLAQWQESAEARRLGLSAWIRSSVAEYHQPTDLPAEELPACQALWIEFWWDHGDRSALCEFARKHSFASLSELLRRILAAASARVLERQEALQ